MWNIKNKVQTCFRILATALLFIIFSVSCDVAPIVGAGAGEVDVVMTGIPAVGSKATFPDIPSVDVEVIQESDGASAGSGTLTHNGTNYSGRITVTGSGNLVFVGLAKNGTEVRYLGNGDDL